MALTMPSRFIRPNRVTRLLCHLAYASLLLSGLVLLGRANAADFRPEPGDGPQPPSAHRLHVVGHHGR